MGRPLGSKNKPKPDFTFDAKKVSKDLMALPAPAKSKKDKRSKKERFKDSVKESGAIMTVFGKDSRKIRDLLDAKDDDNAMLMAQRRMLSMLISIIPTAEHAYKDDPRQSMAYALTGLISQVRELIHDIQSTQDRARVADSIVFNILQPTMVAFANFVIDNNHQTKRDLADLIDVRQKRELDALMNRQAKAIGAYMQTMMDDLKDRITKELSE